MFLLTCWRWFWFLISLAAKKFGVTDFMNPKDHKKPVQEVSLDAMTCYFAINQLAWLACILGFF